MFRINKIMELTVNEILFVNELIIIANEAKEASKLIKDTYIFPSEKSSINLFHDSSKNHFEYLTNDGVWHARYFGQEYDINCSEDSIYRYFKAEYLISNGLRKECYGDYITDEGRMKSACLYLRNFIKKTRELYESNNNVT